jgi:hypothetical protein
MKRFVLGLFITVTGLQSSLWAGTPAKTVASVQAPDKAVKPPSLTYLQAKAYHILPETHNNESGYCSLCIGKNGKVYVGTAKYGVNAYLVEFDPVTERQRIVIDANQVTGATGTGYAAQAKIHTLNFVGPSGKIYVGTKQGYASKEDLANNVKYPGGYVIVYDPTTDKAESLGMPYPGLGVIDVVADEARGLLYVCTCEEGHWMLYSTATKKYRDLGVILSSFMTTLIDKDGRAHVITKDFQLATYDPATDQVAVHPIADGPDKPRLAQHGRFAYHGCMAPDGKTAYLQSLSDPALYQLDVISRKTPVPLHNLGRMIDVEKCDSRASLCLGPDGLVYRVLGIANTTGFGGGTLHHVAQYDPKKKTMKDLGVLGVKNPDFYGLPLDAGGAIDPATGKARPWTHGFHKLPDGTLTPLHHHLAAQVAGDGTLYVTILYPFTLLRVDPRELAGTTPAVKPGGGAKR